jgi:type II secretory ATPase GspE/PulE/Tfp pilus assembly ATPase PilB-like protein
VLRQDPDVVLIGEVRSRETAMLALQAAQTGHLVFATVHANDEIEVFYRVMNLLDDAKLLPVLASTSLLSQSQRLLQRVCPACSSEVVPSSEQARIFQKHGITVQRIRKSNPAGCSGCWSGYHGRVACMSLLPVTRGIARKIASGADAFALREAAEVEGNRSLYAEALNKVAEGITTFAQAELWRNPWDDFALS